MKYLPLVWSGLWRKPTRTVFTLLSIVVAFVLFAILQGVDAGIAHIQDTSRLDRLFVDSRFGAPLPISYLEPIEAIPGVTVVAPRAALFGYWREQANGLAVVMSDERFFAARPELTITKAQLAALRADRSGLVVGAYYAKHYGWKVGDRIPIVTKTPKQDGGSLWVFDVVAIVDSVDDPGDAQYLVGNYDYFDDARATNVGTVSRYIVRIRDPNRAAVTSRSIDRLFANSPAATRTQPEKVQGQSSLNATFNYGAFTKAVVAAAFFSLLIVTANTMMQSVRERTAEFAVLKTIGFTDTAVLALVLSEAGLICLAGAVLGLGLARGLMELTRKQVGALFSHMPPIVILYGLGAAALVALASGLLPAWRAKRIVIAEALATG